ncbi:MAG: YggT family protein [Anaerolineae bacterium]|nr:YggT family protein [Anaerolineae bacterium]
MIITVLIRAIEILFGLFSLALFLRVLLPWFKVAPGNPVLRFLTTFTEPLVRPVRGWLGGGRAWVTGAGYLDFAPVVAFMLLWLVETLLVRLLLLIAFPPLWLFPPAADPARWINGVLGLIFQLYSFALLLRVVLDWIRIPRLQKLTTFLWRITEPVLGPIRRILPRWGGLDFSPVVAILLLSLLQMLLQGLVQALF